MMVSTRVPIRSRFTAGAAASAAVLLFVASLLLSLTLMGATADGAVDDAPIAVDDTLLAVDGDDDDAGSAGAGSLESDDAEALLADIEVTYEAFISRDPFDPVRPEPPADATGDTGNGDGTDDGTGNGTGTGDTGTGTGTGGTGTGGDTGQPVTPDDGCRTNGEAVCDGKVITLREINTDGDVPFAVIQVGTEVYSVEVGDRFADDFRLTSLDITPPCVTLMYGDEVFELCVGDATQK